MTKSVGTESSSAVRFWETASRRIYSPTMPVSSDLHLGTSARVAKTLVELSRTPALVSEVFDDLSNWERVWHPGPDAWNCVEVAGHLLDVELSFAIRIRTALAEPGKLVDSFDGEAWVTTQRHSDVPVEELLGVFCPLRRNLVQLAARLSDEELDRHCIHAKHGHQSILDLLERIKTHDARHLVQLGRTSELARHARPLS